MNAAVRAQPGFPLVGGSLALLQIPFVFTQDDVLNTDEFLRKANERGHNISLDGLQRLHSRRLLLPLYRISGTPVAGRRVNVEPDHGGGLRRWVIDAAADGRLRDPAEEGYSAAWPYTRPQGDVEHGWWNGFVYSSWQLLELGSAVSEYAFTKYPWWHARPERMARDRRLILALAALSPCYLSGVIGRMNIPIGVEEERLWRYRS